MSENDVCDTAMEQQPIIEACTACTSQHQPQGDMHHVIRPRCPERESVTHISERHRSALSRKNHVLQTWASEKKRSAKSSACWSSPAFTLTKLKKYKWRHHHADRTLCRSFSVIVMEILYLTTVNKFGSSSCDNVQSALIRRTRVDEVRRTRTGNHTSSTL